ncbi:MAG: gliding motility-associated ABC transporter substrate-binding protein GldG [Bacteroidales bacterium]|nr:gliding motility-associated ABC transporter substrate-binding protein GldG [Bacteroidales bacterium]
MFALYKKEISSFFSSLTGYLTMIVFLVVTGLMLWVFKSGFNLLDYKYAGLDGLFMLGPFLFLFLIPAITMRMFAEEKRTGTLEFLLTKPLSELTIVTAKFLAGLTLVAVSLIPTLVYYWSVYRLGDPMGNIDTGSVVGSYIGLIFLGGAFVAIGLFASSLTNNQIVAFIVAALLCAFCYLGFDSLYQLMHGRFALLLKELGLEAHYQSISRGVVDTRDVIYFISVTLLFLMLTRTVLRWRMTSVRKQSTWGLAAVVAGIILVNVTSSYLFARIDLTQEKRYTLSKSTKEMLSDLDEQVLFRVYLEGDDLPSEYRRFRNEIKNMLDQFRAYSRYVEYEFVNPNSLKSDEEKQQFYQMLVKKGLTPIPVTSEDDGVQKQQVVYPSMEVSYMGRETALQLQSAGVSGRSTDEVVGSSIENLEYNFVTAIHRLTRPVKAKVGFLLGHGELEKIDLYDIQMSLVEDYTVENVYLDRNIDALTGRVLDTRDSSVSVRNKFDVLVVPKPIRTFTDRDLYVIDQFVMYGGKILWLVDALDADMDSLQNKAQTFATRLPTNLEDMFFNYGVRVNPDLIMDYRCRGIPMMGADNRMQLVPWYYFPTLVPNSKHPIVRNLDVLKTDFVSSIDLINNDIDKTVLLTTSDHVHIKNAPVNIQLSDAMIEVNNQLFNRSALPVAVLLEGQFKSLYRGRLASAFVELEEIAYKEQCDKPTQMIVVSDGDMIRNGTAMSEQGRYPFPLGYDRYTNVEFANKTFLLNAINYLAGDEGMIDARPRNISIRRLDAAKVKEQRGAYQFANMFYPVLSVLVLAAVVMIVRKRKVKNEK